jgi:ribosomal protein S18 acetylase RimI-like enzyme
VLGENSEIIDGGLQCLEEVSRSCTEAHLYYGHFLVMRTADGRGVACCSAYPFPEYDINKTFACLGPITQRVLGWSDSVFQDHLSRLDFLKTAFPDDVPWDGSWFLETVYTEPEFRGRGLSSQLVSRCLEQGKEAGASHSLLIAAQGNDGAKRIYLKQGYEIIGQANSEEAFSVLGCGGFDIFKFKF